MKHWSDSLAKLGACDEAQEWAKTQPSADVAWNACERADWLLWILGRTDRSAPWSEERKPMVRCALACAAEGLRYAKEGKAKEAAEVCVSVTQAWCEKAATVEEVREARSTAYDAYAYARAYDAYAADAASYADSANARARVLRELCDIVRSHYPNPPVLP